MATRDAALPGVDGSIFRDADAWDAAGRSRVPRAREKIAQRSARCQRARHRLWRSDKPGHSAGGFPFQVAALVRTRPLLRLDLRRPCAWTGPVCVSGAHFAGGSILMSAIASDGPGARPTDRGSGFGGREGRGVAGQPLDSDGREISCSRSRVRPGPRSRADRQGHFVSLGGPAELPLAGSDRGDGHRHTRRSFRSMRGARAAEFRLTACAGLLRVYPDDSVEDRPADCGRRWACASYWAERFSRSRA